MGLGEDIKRGYRLLIYPGNETKQAFSLGKALAFYYELTAIPFVLFVILGYIAGSLGMATRLVPFYSSLSFVGLLPALVLAAIFYFWIVEPIGLFINATIYQLVGKNFLKVWNGNYEKTFTAAVFGSLPTVLFYWLVTIPIVNALYIGIMSVWSLIVAVIALANQQKIRRIEAFWTIGAVTAIVLMLVFATLLLWMMPAKILPQ